MFEPRLMTELANRQARGASTRCTEIRTRQQRPVPGGPTAEAAACAGEVPGRGERQAPAGAEEDDNAGDLPRSVVPALPDALDGVEQEMGHDQRPERAAGHVDPQARPTGTHRATPPPWYKW